MAAKAKEGVEPVTRKHRLTRSRQQRKAVRARTRQTFAQAYARWFEASYDAALYPGVHPLVALYRRRNEEAAATLPERLISIVADPATPERR